MAWLDNRFPVRLMKEQGLLATILAKTFVILPHFSVEIQIKVPVPLFWTMLGVRSHWCATNNLQPKDFSITQGERGKNLYYSIFITVNCWFLAVFTKKKREERSVLHPFGQDCRHSPHLSSALSNYSIYGSCYFFLLGQFDKAKTTFLKACIRSPSCVSWLGAGVACYRVSE